MAGERQSEGGKPDMEVRALSAINQLEAANRQMRPVDQASFEEALRALADLPPEEFGQILFEQRKYEDEGGYGLTVISKRPKQRS